MGKHYKEEFKLKVVEDYLEGMRYSDVIRKYEILPNRLKKWTKQFKETGRCEDRSGKNTGPQKGRPKRIPIEEMTKDEYIKYLEMENDILKKLSSLSFKVQK